MFGAGAGCHVCVLRPPRPDASAACATATVAGMRVMCTKGLPGANLAPGVHDPGQRQCVHNRSEPTSPWSVDCAVARRVAGLPVRRPWPTARPAPTTPNQGPPTSHGGRSPTRHLVTASKHSLKAPHSLCSALTDAPACCGRLGQASRSPASLVRLARRWCVQTKRVVVSQECTQPCDGTARSRARTLPQWWAGRGRGPGGRRGAGGRGGAARNRAPHWYVLLWRP